MKRIAAALVVGVALSGCAAPVNKLRGDPSIHKEVAHLDAAPATVYRNVVTAARECWNGMAFLYPLQIDKEFFPDTSEGEVTMYFNDLGDRFVQGDVQIKPAAAGTDITYFSRRGSNFPFGDWARGSKECPSD